MVFYFDRFLFSQFFRSRNYTPVLLLTVKTVLLVPCVLTVYQYFVLSYEYESEYNVSNSKHKCTQCRNFQVKSYRQLVLLDPKVLIFTGFVLLFSYFLNSIFLLLSYFFWPTVLLLSYFFLNMRWTACILLPTELHVHCTPTMLFQFLYNSTCTYNILLNPNYMYIMCR